MCWGSRLCPVMHETAQSHALRCKTSIPPAFWLKKALLIPRGVRMPSLQRLNEQHPLRYLLCFPGCASPTPVSFLTLGCITFCASQAVHLSAGIHCFCHVLLFGTPCCLLRRIVCFVVLLQVLSCVGWGTTTTKEPSCAPWASISETELQGMIVDGDRSIDSTEFLQLMARKVRWSSLAGSMELYRALLVKVSSRHVRHSFGCLCFACVINCACMCFHYMQFLRCVIAFVLFCNRCI